MIQGIATLEMDETLERLCVSGVLKLEHEAKGLTQIHNMLYELQVTWISIILS